MKEIPKSVIKKSKMLEKIKKFIKDIKELRNETLTVMFVPHSEKRILTLHISYFTIGFIIFLLLATALFSTLALLTETTKKQEVVNVIEKNKIWTQKEKLLKKSIEDLNEKLEVVKAEIEKLYLVSSYSPKQSLNLWAKGGFVLQSVTNEDNKFVNEFQDIYNLKQISYDINLSARYIEQIKNFIEAREKIFEKLPTIWPLKVGGYITSEFGWRQNPVYKRRMEFHTGIDIASWPGAPVAATADGIVVEAGWKSGYGLTVIINHAYGFKTYYAHLSRIKTYAGKKVKRGDIIGFLGRTGFTTGHHLHYEVRVGTEPVNPMEYIITTK